MLNAHNRYEKALKKAKRTHTTMRKIPWYLRMSSELSGHGYETVRQVSIQFRHEKNLSIPLMR